MPSPRGGSSIGGPSPALPKGRELFPTEFEDVVVLLLPLGRALKKSPFFMTKTENAYDL